MLRNYKKDTPATEICVHSLRGYQCNVLKVVKVACAHPVRHRETAACNYTRRSATVCTRYTRPSACSQNCIGRLFDFLYSYTQRKLPARRPPHVITTRAGTCLSIEDITVHRCILIYTQLTMNYDKIKFLQALVSYFIFFIYWSTI